jgi:ABC-2 type transport system ATP-binding protein
VCSSDLLADRIAIIRNGRIIADGTFAALSQTFVGVPLMELRVNGELNGMAEDLGDVVEVEQVGLNWVRYRVPDPTTTNPQIIHRVIGLGKEVVTLAPVSQSLEDVYLKAVEEDEKNGRNNS